VSALQYLKLLAIPNVIKHKDGRLHLLTWRPTSRTNINSRNPVNKVSRGYEKWPNRRRNNHRLQQCTSAVSTKLREN
jgi:hypothetical protein